MESLKKYKDFKCRLRKYNNRDVIYVDGLATVVESVHKNIIKGFILGDDFSEEKTFVAQNNGYTAHGKTIKDALKAAEDKFFNSLGFESKKQKFLKNFSEKNKKYPAKDFFDWHFYLTGSCLQGRLSFVKEKNIDIEKDSFTVEEFFELTKGVFGWERLQGVIESA